MADRTVKVTLKAQVENYLANMEAASKATNKVGETLEAQKAASIEAAKAQGQAFGDLGAIATKAGLVVAAGIAVAILKFAEFDAAMSNVQAATQETAQNMDRLREAALDAGASTVFSATEAANAIEELGKAGLTTEEILSGGLDGALALASAGQLEVARAAEVAAITMKQFKLEGADVPHIADLLASGAGKAAGDVEDLAQALNQSALVAHATGLSVEETTGALSAFASAGLLGSDAGTSFKTALAALTPKSDEAGKLMESLGFSAYDAAGNFVGIAKTAGNLQNALKDLTVEQRNSYLTTIFGSDAIRVANILYAEGEEGIQKYIDATNDQGYAAQVAADRLDNLKGDVEQLGGAFDTALIRSGSGANDMLREITQNVTFLVTAVGDAPQPLLNLGLTLGTVTAAMLLVGGTTSTLLPKFAALKATVSASGISMGTFAIRTAAAGGVLAVAGLALGAFVSQAAEAKARTDELRESLDQATGSTTSYTREVVAKSLTDSGATETAKALGLSLKEITDAAFGNADAIDKVNKAVDEYQVNPFGGDAQDGVALVRLTDRIKTLRGEIEAAPGELKNLDEAIGDNQSATQDAAAAYLEASDEVASLNDELEQLITQVNKANGVGQDAVSANAAYRASLSDAKKEIKEFAAENGVSSKNLDQTTASGSANAKMLSDLAADAQKAAEAQFKLDGDTAAYQKRLEEGRDKFIENGLAISGNREQVEKLADEVFGLPTKRQIDILADTSRAEAELRRLQSRWQGDTIKLRATVDGKLGSGILGRATGGLLPGAPSSKDNMLIAAASGEYVTNARATQDPYNRSMLEYMNAGGSMANYSPVAASSFASSVGGGGSVSITVPVTVKALAVDNPDLLARTVATAAKDAVRNGVLPSNWSVSE